MAPQTQADWGRWEEKVLGDLDRLEKRTSKILEELVAMREQIAALQVRASVWGFVAGGLGSILGAIAVYLLRR
jgi:hypothetical protein